VEGDHRPEPTSRTLLSEQPLDAVARRWVETNIVAQRQRGYVTATVRLLLGDMTVRQMQDLAGLAERFNGGRLVNTVQQNVLLPWVREQDLGALHEVLQRVGCDASRKSHQALLHSGLAGGEADRIEDVTSCPGADSCQIGITASRGLARRLAEVLAKPAYQTPDLDGAHIKVSGCPNSCGQHHIATIGFFGGAKRVNDRLVPHYQMLLGGATRQGGASFGEPIMRLPASRVPEAVERLIGYYRAHRQGDESLAAFARRMGKEAIVSLIAPLVDLPPYESAPELYADWGQSQPFTLQGVGQGECAGG
jgi:ferredoxin-nitrite reductase/sulfite reductase (ferredoxin)